MRLHVAWTAACCFRQLRLITVIRSCIKSLPFEAARAAVAAFVSSQVDRCNSLLAGAPGYLLDGLQSVINAVVRLICNRRKYDHGTPSRRPALAACPVPRRRLSICTTIAQILIPPRLGCDLDRQRRPNIEYGGRGRASAITDYRPLVLDAGTVFHPSSDWPTRYTLSTLNSKLICLRRLIPLISCSCD